MPPMEPTPEMLRALRQERIERARRQHPVDKLLAGPELFDSARFFMVMGVQAQFPDANEAEVQRIVRERLAKARRKVGRP